MTSILTYTKTICQKLNTLQSFNLEDLDVQFLRQCERQMLTMNSSNNK